MRKNHKEKEKAKDSLLKRITYDIILLILLAIFIYAVFYLKNYFDNKGEERDLIQTIQLQKQQTVAEEILDETEADGFEKKAGKVEILPEYKKLFEENNDMYGWIKINGTEIDYPVLYTPEDPNFYINKNWKKEICFENIGNSIFIAGQTTENSNNIIIYGHNMNDGSMFGSLKKYRDEAYYQEHKYIEFDTLYEKQIFEVICVSKAVVYYEDIKPEDAYLFYEHTDLNSEEEFDEYLENVRANVYYDITTEATYGDELITLCTCNNWRKNGRLLVVAKKIEFSEMIGDE